MQTVKKIILPALCRTALAPKKQLISFSGKIVFCEKSNVTLLTNTSNNVFQIKEGEAFLYFRECKRHKEIHQYVRDEIDFYYHWLHPELADDKEFLIHELSDERNFRRFIKMGMINDFSSGAYCFCSGGRGEKIGLSIHETEQEMRLRSFVQFVWGDLFAYELNGGVSIGDFQTYNAVRAIAFRKIAEMLGVPQLIPKTQYGILRISGEEDRFGTIMECASGCCMEKDDYKMRLRVASPALQRELNCLNALDVICREKDHRVGNYNVTCKNGQAVSISAFDNDSPMSFGLGGASFSTYMECSPWISKGKLNRPYFDKTMAIAIQNLEEQSLNYCVGNLLNKFQMFALKRRIARVKHVLFNTPKNVFIEDNMWDEKTMEEELSGNYGDTYLSLFLRK